MSAFFSIYFTEIINLHWIVVELQAHFCELNSSNRIIVSIAAIVFMFQSKPPLAPVYVDVFSGQIVH
jgi:hypothetical protein